MANCIIILRFILKILINFYILNSIFFVCKFFFKKTPYLEKLHSLIKHAIFFYEGASLLYNLNLDIIEFTEVVFTF